MELEDNGKHCENTIEYARTTPTNNTVCVHPNYVRRTDNEDGRTALSLTSAYWRLIASLATNASPSQPPVVRALTPLGLHSGSAQPTEPEIANTDSQPYKIHMSGGLQEDEDDETVEFPSSKFRVHPSGQHPTPVLLVTSPPMVGERRAIAFGNCELTASYWRLLWNIRAVET
ncbi:hypothetical protein EVAR_49808_1 [Eumeta japonica]|uniref:Uncharacterized protein n=1 Tax=Eumeta variegata TaxID=151549 RepID=A0A4C1XLT6_EUMVA|nr:hypothetical protein EVAR_49808_1 [Eumeta japonica]